MRADAPTTAAAEHAELARDAREGLSRRPKRLPSKYFYDARGSALFERICEQPEYYLTRSELAILRRHGADIAQAVGPKAMVVEFGSGSGVKTRLLLDALASPVAYAPVEISASALNDSVAGLSASFPEIEMLPHCADFTRPFELPRSRRAADSVLMFFPGSTLGNFEPEPATRLLQLMDDAMGPGGAALIGIDLRKDPLQIEAAYNDAAGVTAAFTLNLLTRLNRELDADFDLSRFAHRARYDEVVGRIETHIVSLATQRVRVGDRSVGFERNEPILVEYSHKYSSEGFAAMAASVGLDVAQSWSDPASRFALKLLRHTSG